MNLFTSHINSSTKEQIADIFKFLGFAIPGDSTKEQMIVTLLEDLTNSPLTWLKRLPGAELFTMYSIVTKDDPPKILPYKLILERFHIIKKVKGKYKLSSEFYKIKPSSFTDTLDINEPKNFYTLERYLFGILSAHGIIKLSRLKTLLQKIDPDNYPYFISNSIILRFLIKKIDDTLYVFHPSIQNTDKIYGYRKKIQKYVTIEKEYTFSQYYNFSDVTPYIFLGIDNEEIKNISKIATKNGINNYIFRFAYHDLFIECNEGNILNCCTIIYNIIHGTKDFSTYEQYLYQILLGIYDVPLWIMGGFSINEVRRINLLTLDIHDIIKEFTEDILSSDLFQFPDKKNEYES